MENQPLLVSEEPATFLVNATQSLYFGDGSNYEEPPPYTPSPSTPTYSGSSVSLSSDIPMINCRVCQMSLQVEGKLHLHVVKCHACGEATPIRPAPPMKKYVRCPCNCLLICKVTSQRIVCPRVNCKRIISLAPMSQPQPMISDDERAPLTGSRRVVCFYCNFSFVARRPKKYFQNCPNCNRRSYSSSFIKKFIVGCFGLTFLLCIGLSIGTTYIAFDNDTILSNKAASYGLMGCAYVGMVAIAIWLIYFIRMRVSKIETFSSLSYT